MFRSHKKLQSSTVFEVVVALVILLTMLGLTFLITVNIIRSGSHAMELRAGGILETIALQTKNEKAFFDDEIKVQEFMVERRVKQYNGYPGILWLHVDIKDPQNKILASYNELVPAL